MRDRTKRRALVVSCATLFACGLFGSSIGPALPNLARNASTDLAAIGAVFTAVFLGALLSQLAAGAAGDRFGHKPVLILGLVLTALGVLGIAVSPSLPLVLASALICGIGDGIIVLGSNLIIADVFADKSVMALNLANVFFGIGSVSGPALSGLVLGVWRTSLPVLWLAAVVLLVPAFIAMGLRLPPPVRHSEDRQEKASALYSSPLLWAFGLLLLVYVGVEVGTGGWLVTYLNRSAQVPIETAALITSAYWLALTAGRVLGAYFSNKLEGAKLLLLGLCGALVGGSLLLASTGNAAITIPAVLLLGLSFAPVYPTSIALVTAAFRNATGKAAGVVMTLASLGGAIIPWLLGLLIVQVAPRAGAVLIALCAVAMLSLYSVTRLFSSRRERAAVPPSVGPAGMRKVS